MDVDAQIRAAGGGRTVGRYVLYDAVATGGMASVHFGRLLGPVGFARTVAIKRPHPQHARDPEFVAMFLDEARLAARIRHPNVVSTLDVVTTHDEAFLVMEYVQGESLQGLLRTSRATGTAIPLPVLGGIIGGMLHGLHAAHEARSEGGEPLLIVHRDVSPQNVLVGEDGIARLADFGIAKAAWRVQSTRDGVLKGKLSYMAPEQFRRGPVDRRVDLYAASVVLWEALAGRKLHDEDDPAALVASVMSGVADPPSRYRADVSPELDAVVLRGLAADPGHRFDTALAMATALEDAMPPAPQGVVGAWVRSCAAEILDRRAARIATIEATPGGAPDDGATDPQLHGPFGGAPADALRHIAEATTSPGTGVDDAPGPDAQVPVEEGPIEVAPAWVPEDEPPPPRRSRGLALPALLLGAVLGLLGAGAGMRWWGKGVPSASAAPIAVAPTPPPSSVPIPGNVAPSAGVTVPFVETPIAVSARVVSPVAPVAARPAAPRKSASDVRRKDCDPPYTLDPSSTSADGKPVKRFKVWCL